MKRTLKETLGFVLKTEPKTIKDRNYLLAYVWTYEDHPDIASPQFNERLGQLYTFLLKHFSADSIIREKERILETDPVLAESYESTEKMKNEIINGQTALPMDEGKKRLKEAREVMK